ncbi:TfpX/TfpZ family type IV pilin accessory protein [Aquabacterium humicola]|uniref:TfpX/TfpZ family type IV pilin accessory protein n=1 Tax=Aquabacterium humicola TaxID=3237377 RepID=UPI00254359DF|nr:TfpX/TfpZ family type IV pilin accessory protein [Rubrivivax pictus]
MNRVTALPALDLRTRIKAALIHLSGSAFVAGIAAALIFLLWYPWPYAALSGGSKLFLLITGVDIVLGPAITFAIFDLRKGWPHLRRDLAVIVVLQLAALGYGMHTMYLARPVALALESNRFRVVAANDVIAEELGQAPAELRALSITGPRQLRTITPTDADELMKSIEMALAGADLGTRPKYWRAWDDTARRETRENGKPLKVLRTRYPARAAELDEAVARSGRSDDQLVFVPVISRHADWVALIDKASGDVVGFAPFNAY